jgi:hypothetical protein
MMNTKARKLLLDLAFSERGLVPDSVLARLYFDAAHKGLKPQYRRPCSGVELPTCWI